MRLKAKTLTMNRRNLLGAGLCASAVLASGAAAAAPQSAPLAPRPLSYAARHGWLPNVPLLAHPGATYHFYDDLVRDRIILLNFFVVACTEGRCPVANQNLRKVQDMFGDRMGRDVFFYSVTLEPEKDTQPILKEYAEDIFEVGPGWLFLTGKPADVEALRVAQGFVDQDPERDRDVSNHSSTARLIADRKGRWAMVPLNTSPRNIYTSLATL